MSERVSEEEYEELLDLFRENNLTQYGIDKLYGEIIDRQIEKNKKIERLNNIINKAIEYIERYETISGYYDSNYDGEADTYSHDNVKDDLLQMLDKDSDN